MLSLSVDYALRAIVIIAARGGSPVTSHEISQATRVPAPYLSKIMQGLAKAGIVRSQRGVHGGFVLARVAATLSVLEVVNAVDPLLRIRECPLGFTAHVGTLCPLHRRLDQAISMVEQAFRETTIAELVESAGETPLCQAGGDSGLQTIELLSPTKSGDSDGPAIGGADR